MHSNSKHFHKTRYCADNMLRYARVFSAIFAIVMLDGDVLHIFLMSSMLLLRIRLAFFYCRYYEKHA